MKLKNDIPVSRIYRHELIYDVAPFKKRRLTLFNSYAQSFFNLDNHFFEYRNNSGQVFRRSLAKTPRLGEFSFLNLGSEVLSTKSFRKQGIALKNSKKAHSKMYEWVYSDAWFRKKVLPYYLSLIKKHGRYCSSWCNLPRIHMGAKITPLCLNYPQQFLLKIRKNDYDCLTLWVQQFIHAVLLIFNSSTQFISIDGHFVRHFQRIRTWMCKLSNFIFYKGGFWFVN